MSKLVIPHLEEEAWAQSLLAVYPADWTGDQAKEAGGILFSLFKSMGVDLKHVNEQVEYAFKTTRIETAIDVGLDAVAQDFFGDGSIAGFPQDVIRVPGEPDESFRKRIKASLLLEAGTREALIKTIELLTGERPRVSEPWSPGDTNCWDLNSYYDIDTEQNPFRMGDPQLKWQGFVESILPSFGNQGDNPVYANDAGWYWDTFTGYYIDPLPSWWIGSRVLDAVINKIKPLGTIVWRKYRGTPLVKNPMGGYMPITPGAYEITIDLFPPLAGLFTVLAGTNWQTGVSYVQLNGNDKIKFVLSNPAPANAQLYFYACPITVGGNGLVSIPLDGETLTLGVQPDFVNRQCLITPSWTTDYWLHYRDDDELTFRFASPAPLQATVAYAFLPLSGSVDVSPDADTITIPISTRDPFQAFANTNWNTSIEIIKNSSFLTIVFAVPAPANAKVYWGINES